jgi:hypothetical protein
MSNSQIPRAAKRASTVEVTTPALRPSCVSARRPDPPVLEITPETKKLVGENRWNRNRKHVRELSLTLEYPTDSEMQELARLAKVDSPDDFGSHIRSIILDANLLHAVYRNLSAPEVRNKLESVRKKADALKEALKNIDLGCGSSAERAGQMLETTLSSFKFREGMVLIPEYVALLTEQSKAAGQTVQQVKSKRGPKGAGGNFAFDLFIEHLQMAARQRRGRWTISLAPDKNIWSGSLLKGLDILKPYLPTRFFPPNCPPWHQAERRQDRALRTMSKMRRRRSL